MTNPPHSTLKYYRPSGAAPIGGVLATLAVGCAAAILLGFIYAFANHHDPILYLNVLLSFGFGIALGWVVSRGIRKHHIRNTAVTALIAIVVFLVGYVTHWLFYIATVIVDSSKGSSFDIVQICTIAWDLLQDPENTLDIIGELNRRGVWTIGRPGRSSSSTPVRGLFLMAFWIAEAAAVGFFSIAGPVGDTKKPYSDRSSRWIEPTVLPACVAFVDDKEKFLSALSRGDYTALTTPQQPAVTEVDGNVQESTYAIVTLYKDALSPCVSVTNFTVKPKGKKVDTANDEILEYLLVTPTAAQSIETALAEMPDDAPTEEDEADQEGQEREENETE